MDIMQMNNKSTHYPAVQSPVLTKLKYILK
jgi:hypothetical protein